MVKDADCADNLSSYTSFVEAIDITGVADHEWCKGTLFTTLDTASTAVCVEENLIDVSIKHVGAVVDSAKARERLWETTETVNGIQEGGITVFAHRFHVELHLAACFERWFL